MEVKDEVTPYLDEVTHELGKLAKKKITVGIQGVDGKLLTIATVHEFGCVINVTKKMRNYLHTIGLHLRNETGVVIMPERSFIRASFDTGKAKIIKIIEEEIFNIIYHGKSADRAANVIGVRLLEVVKEYFNSGAIQPPKSEFTQSRSNQEQVLVDTGRLSKSFTYKVTE